MKFGKGSSVLWNIKKSDFRIQNRSLCLKNFTYKKLCVLDTKIARDNLYFVIIPEVSVRHGGCTHLYCLKMVSPSGQVVVSALGNYNPGRMLCVKPESVPEMLCNSEANFQSVFRINNQVIYEHPEPTLWHIWYSAAPLSSICCTLANHQQTVHF